MIKIDKEYKKIGNEIIKIDIKSKIPNQFNRYISSKIIYSFCSISQNFHLKKI